MKILAILHFNAVTPAKAGVPLLCFNDLEGSGIPASAEMTNVVL